MAKRSLHSISHNISVSLLASFTWRSGFSWCYGRAKSRLTCFLNLRTANNVPSNSALLTDAFRLAALRMRRGKTRTLGGMSVRRAALKVGVIYFGVAYEDDEFTRPILHTYEYLGETSDAKEASFLFRFVGSDDQIELAERQLD